MPASPYTDLDRPPLSRRALDRALVTPGGLWTRIDVRAETASTNADCAEAAAGGAPEGLVVVAEQQTAGRGRRERQWVSPPRAGLTLSVLLRPGVADPAKGWPAAPVGAFGWLPLLAGVALLEAVQPGRRGRGRPQVAQRPAGRRRQMRRHPGRDVRRRGGRRDRTERDHPAGRVARDQRPAGDLAQGWPAPPPPTATRCCGRCCAASPAGTAAGVRRAPTPSCPGCSRRTGGAAPRSAGRSGCCCPAAAS